MSETCGYSEGGWLPPVTTELRLSDGDLILNPEQCAGIGLAYIQGRYKILREMTAGGGESGGA